MEPHSFDVLGGKPRPKDPRDYLIGGADPVGYTFAPTHTRAVPMPHYYQGKRPACGAHAGTHLKVFLNRKDGKTSEDDTPRYLWANIKRDGTSPSDGTSMDRIFKTLQTYGADAFLPLGNDVTLDDGLYAAVNALTAAMVAQGEVNTILSYAYPTDMSFNGIKQTINDFGHALLLIHANAQMWTAPNGQTSWTEAAVLPLRPPTAEYPVVSGHFILADSYDEHYIYGVNSFGPTWGRGGDFYFGPDYASQVLEVGVAYNAPVVQNVPVQAVAAVLQPLPGIVHEIETLPAAKQPYYKQVLLGILASLVKLLVNKQVATGSVGATIDPMPQKQFTGFLSSTANPGQLALTASSFTNALLSAAALYAAVKGLDAATVTSQVQQIIDIAVTGVAAGMTVYHSVMTLYGLAHKIIYSLFAKPVVTVQVATPVPTPLDGTTV